MAGDGLRVDPEALGSLAATLATVAADLQLAHVRATPLTEVASELPGSQTGAACRDAVTRIAGALATVAARVEHTGAAVTQAVSTFARTDVALERELRRAGER